MAVWLRRRALAAVAAGLPRRPAIDGGDRDGARNPRRDLGDDLRRIAVFKIVSPATATKEPLLTAYLMAASIAGAQPSTAELVVQLAGPLRPMLMLMTCAPLSAAYRIPRATTSSVPSLGDPKMSSQTPLMTLTGISLTLKAIPAVPMLSFVSCPTVPLTCVPCPSRSSGVVVSQMKSWGATNRPGLSSWGAAANGMVTRPSAG